MFLRSNERSGFKSKIRKKVQDQTAKRWDQEPITEQQKKIDKFIEYTFDHWKGNSEFDSSRPPYMRVGEFCKKMVMFGLVPSLEFIDFIIKEYRRALPKATSKLTLVRDKHDKKPPGVRVYDQEFVYSMEDDSITHISLAPIKKLFSLNHVCESLAQFLHKSLVIKEL